MLMRKQKKNPCKELSQPSGGTPQRPTRPAWHLLACLLLLGGLLENHRHPAPAGTEQAGSPQTTARRRPLSGDVAEEAASFFQNQLHFLNCKQIITAPEGKQVMPGHTIIMLHGPACGCCTPSKGAGGRAPCHCPQESHAGPGSSTKNTVQPSAPLQQPRLGRHVGIELLEPKGPA